jgi:hypothetical protein
MSSTVILGFAIVVMILMLAGLVLSLYEFLKITKDPATRE